MNTAVWLSKKFFASSAVMARAVEVLLDKVVVEDGKVLTVDVTMEISLFCLQPPEQTRNVIITDSRM